MTVYQCYIIVVMDRTYFITTIFYIYVRGKKLHDLQKMPELASTWTLKLSIHLLCFSLDIN